MTVGISITICCYNSAERLPETLRYIASQKIPQDLMWEVIVVDNGSSDNTAEIAKYEWKKYNIGVPILILTEPKVGKTNAFKTAVNKSSFEYLLICDDDNWLNQDYVSIAYELLSEDSNIGVLGGCGILQPEQPEWSEVANFQDHYVTGQQHPSINHYVYGAGSIYRKSVLNELALEHWQTIAVGRSGSKLICGEDIETCFAIYLKRFKIVYSDRLQFKHFVPLSRQNQDYLLRLDYWLSYSYVLLTGYVMLIDGDKRAISQRLNEWLVLTLKALTLFGFAASKQLITKRKKLNFDQRRKLNSYLGTLASLIQNKKRLISHKAHLDKLFPSVKN